MATYLKITILLLSLSATICAQHASIKFDQIGPVIIPNCILQDSYGFIWIGAQEGLIRYDGYNFKRYTNIPFDSTSLSNNWVTDIKEDKKGNLWIGTWGGGLNYFDQKSEKFKSYRLDQNKSNYISNLNINSIVVNEDGSLWLGTQNRGLINLKFDINGKFVTEMIDLNSDTNAIAQRGEIYVLDLFKDRNNNLWIGTINGGLKMLDPNTGKITYFKHNPDNPNSISCNNVSTICEDKYGNLWIGTGNFAMQNGRGLNKFDPVSKQFTHYVHNPGNPNSIASNNVASLLIDSEGILWIGTLGNYINSIPVSELLTNSNPRFTHHKNFSKSNINKIYEDHLGNIWIGLWGRDVYIYNRQQNPFTWYRYIWGESSTLRTSARMIYPDKSGNIWFGGGGLDRYNPAIREYIHYHHDPDDPYSLSSNQTTSMCEDKYGYYWIGTADMGLNRFDPKTGNFYHFQEDPVNPYGLGSNIISEVSTSNTGDIWIASPKSGIQLYNIEENRFYHFSLDTSMTADLYIYGIYADHEGILWIHTSNYGLYSLKLKNLKIEKINHYHHDPNNYNSLSYNSVSDVIRPQKVDSNALWVGTDNGLNRLDLITDTFTHFYMEDGLPSNFILKVLEDDNGNIWCTCATGLAVYDIRTGRINSFSKDDGMPISDFGGRPQNACKTHDGQLIFGAAWGALGFYPDQLKRNMIIPPIHLTDFKIYHESAMLDTSIQFAQIIELTYDQNAFSFEFVALNYINPAKNQYKYKLEGLHDDWIHCANERIASFTNIDPGHYIFHVTGSNNHGVWNKTGKSVKIIIHPPWWRTSWAYFIYILLFGTLIYILRQYDLRRQHLKYQLSLEHEHTEKLQEIDRMKSRFFANISHEFRTPLTLILGPVSRLMNNITKKEDIDDLNLMHRNARRLQRLINALLNLSKIEEGKLKLQVQKTDIVYFLNRIVQSFESQAQIKNINLTFSTKLKSRELYIDRTKMEDVFYNLLSNAFKFTPEDGLVEVSLREVRQQADDEALSSREGIPVQARDDEDSPLSTPLNKGGIIGGIQISVSNTGPHIPEDEIDKIFDRFYRVKSDNNHMEGTGIGLALVKELIELHHGEISAKSEYNADMKNLKELPESVNNKMNAKTTFTILLQTGKKHFRNDEIMSRVAEKKDETETDGMTQAGKTYDETLLKQASKLLIVEDNKDMRLYIRNCFKDEYNIIEAKDGEEGYNMSIGELPDLIISDVMMPKLDGFKMCQKIKNDQRTSHIPVILLTARAEMNDKIDGLDLGADDYIVKPFEIKELQVRVKNLIQQREKLRKLFANNEEYMIKDITVTSQDEKFLNKAIGIIEENMADSGFNVDSFVNEIGISRAHLYHKFKTITGQSVKEFMRTIRLKRAAQLIKKNAGNITEIAYEVGFSNPSYFTKCFRKQFGNSPTHYIH